MAAGSKFFRQILIFCDDSRGLAADVTVKPLFGVFPNKAAVEKTRVM